MGKEKKPIPLPRLDLILDFTDKKQGLIALLVGILVAIILGILAINLGWATTWLYWVLGIGVVVGILNIFHEEGVLFLVSGLTLTLMLNILAGLALFPAWAVTLFNAAIYLLAPTLVIVSLKVLYALAVK